MLTPGNCPPRKAAKIMAKRRKARAAHKRLPRAIGRCTAKSASLAIQRRRAKGMRKAAAKPRKAAPRKRAAAKRTGKKRPVAVRPTGVKRLGEGNVIDGLTFIDKVYAPTATARQLGAGR